MSSPRSITQWDLEADVVVLGSGIAGIVAALEAHEIDPAASVVILEKEPVETAGGNSRMSGQSLSFPVEMAAYRAYQAARAAPPAGGAPRRLGRGRTDQRTWVEQKAAEVDFELVPWGDFGAEFPDISVRRFASSIWSVPRPSSVPA